MPQAGPLVGSSDLVYQLEGVEEWVPQVEVLGEERWAAWSTLSPVLLPILVQALELVRGPASF